MLHHTPAKLVTLLSCSMISPLVFITTSFDPINKLQEIYEIILLGLEHHVQSSKIITYTCKKVANHIKPVTTTLPKNFWIVCCIPCDPLDSMLPLSTYSSDFSPGSYYTSEWMNTMNINLDGFLWPEEEKLIHHLIWSQELSFTWTEEGKEKFSSDYFDPITIPTIEHIRWVLWNIPIPPGIFH